MDGKTDKKILFTTVYRKNRLYDYFEANTNLRFIRFSYPKIFSSGLRFIKQNIPEVEILEYPTLDEYKEKIRKGRYDIVGFSFYMFETYEILEMIKFARANGVKEIWGGKYGILTKPIEKYFDKVFVGYSEYEIAKMLNRRIEKIKHPPLIYYIGTPFGLKIVSVGMLFTSRGCNLKCKFCQTPSFCPNAYEIPLDSIEQVLKYYRKLGINHVIICDENFGLIRKQSENVISLLEGYGFYWHCIVRPDILMDNLDDWCKRGLIGAVFGIESLSQRNLDFVGKRENINKTLSLLKELDKKNIFSVGTYVIGFEDDTIESIKSDMRRLRSENLDIYQLCILTPFPKTSIWDYLEKKYGIFEKDYHKYDAKHLVWNHPHIKPKEAEKLLKWCFRTVHPRKRFLDTALQFGKKYTEDSFFDGIKQMVKMLIRANTINYKPKRFL